MTSEAKLKVAKPVKNSSLVIIGFFTAFWFAVGLGMFMAQYTPFMEPLERSFWAGLLLPLNWAIVGIWLYGRLNFKKSALWVFIIGLVLMAVALAGVFLK